MYTQRANNIRRKPLPGKLFLVRVPIIATYSDTEIDLLGLPVDTNTFGGYNPKTYNNFTTCMLPLDRLVDIYMQNYPIYVVNQSDTVEIYNILEEYLTGESEPETFSRNLEARVEDRLVDIEKFASEMFGYNRGTIARDMYQRDLQNNIINGLSLNLTANMSIDSAKNIVNNNPDIQRFVEAAEVSRVNANKDANFGLKSKEEFILPTKLPTGAVEVKSNGEMVNISYIHNSLPDFNIDNYDRIPTENGYRKKS